MAVTAAGAALSDAHRVLQAKVSAQTVAQLAKVWPLLDPYAIDRTVDAWLVAASAVVLQQRSISDQVARQYLAAFRDAEVPGSDPLGLPPPVPPAADALTTSLLTQGPIAIKAASGADLVQVIETARLASAVAGTRHALNGGRDLIVAATDADPIAHGVRRITSPGCCAFCAMLAARSADGLSSNATRSGMESFKVHDNCHCFPETAYATGFQDATRQAKEFHALYHEATAGVGGSKAQLNAFRRALAAQRA